VNSCPQYFEENKFGFDVPVHREEIYQRIAEERETA